MITLWGRHNSINVQKVLWTLDEAALDQWLGERPFVAGQTLSVADIPAGALMHRCVRQGDHAATVDAWRDRLTERPPYRTRAIQACLLSRLDHERVIATRDEARTARACSRFANQLNDSVETAFTINLS